MENKIALRPSYWASVSGGKDSLFMLNLILHNLDKYPLDGVVHFELEIDFPFIHDVIDYMKSECNKHKIPFYIIKPRKSWEELYDKYGFPTRIARWCNNHYKLDAKEQLEEFLNSKGYYSVHYIGYCVDEESRYKKRVNRKVLREIYPLVEQNINENYIWQWAKNQPIYNDYYKINKRCGCMYCPMASLINHAYLLKYYPQQYEYMIEKAKETEALRLKELGRKFSVWGRPQYDTKYRDDIIKQKYLKKIEDIINEREQYQYSIFDCIEKENNNG